MTPRTPNPVLESEQAVAGSDSKPQRPGAPETVTIGILPISRMRIDEVADAVIRHVGKDPAERHVMRIFGVNAQIAVLVKEHEKFAEAILAGDILFADGVSIVLASRLFGVPLEERVAGGEVMELLCAKGAQKGFSAYFLGGLPGAAEKTAQIMSTRYPGLKIAGHYCPPFGFEKDPEECARILKTIQTASPDMLFVCVGVPKQEIWIQENAPYLPVGLAFPVGAAFDTTAGLRKRAPVWSRNTGTEWLYRLVMEPRRLWRRYLIGNPKFVWMVLRQWMRKEEKSLRSVTG